MEKHRWNFACCTFFVKWKCPAWQHWGKKEAARINVLLPLHGCWGVGGRKKHSMCSEEIQMMWCVLLLSQQRAGKPRWSHLAGPGRAFNNKMHPENSRGADYTFIGFRPCLGQCISTSHSLSRICGLKLFKSFCWPINTILFKKILKHDCCQRTSNNASWDLWDTKTPKKFQTKTQTPSLTEETYTGGNNFFPARNRTWTGLDFWFEGHLMYLVFSLWH